MNGPFTVCASIVSGFLGFSAVWTTGDFLSPSDDSPPAIVVHDITIRVDGSTNYDRDAVEGSWSAWSGQIFGHNKDVHCSGGDLSQYFHDQNPLDRHDVDWLIGDECMDGLVAGMTYVFTWTPLGDDLAPVRYPATGYGVVQPAR